MTNDETRKNDEARNRNDRFGARLLIKSSALLGVIVCNARRVTYYCSGKGLDPNPASDASSGRSNVLPASRRQVIRWSIVTFCRQDAGSTLTRGTIPIRDALRLQ